MSSYKISNPIKNVYKTALKYSETNSINVSTDGVVFLNFTTILVNNEQDINLVLPTNPSENEQNVIYNFIILKQNGGDVFIDTGYPLKIITIKPEYNLIRFIYTPYSIPTTEINTGINTGRWIILNNFSESNHNGKDYNNVNSVHNVNTSIINPFQNGYGFDVVWGDDKFVAVGLSLDGINIFNSIDGINWTPSSIIPNTFIQVSGVCWGGNINIGYKYIAVGRNNYENNSVSIVYSYDGINWTNADNNPFDGEEGSGYSVAYGGGVYVVLGYGSYSSLAYSTDGKKWLIVSSELYFYNVGNIIWGGAIDNEKFLGIGQNDMLTTTIFYSTDGKHWELVDETKQPFSGSGVGILTWSKTLNIFVAGASNGIAYSSDGIDWANSDNNPFINGGEVRGLTWAGGTINKFIATGKRGIDGYDTIAYSLNGIDWIDSYPITGYSYLHRIGWSGETSNILVSGGVGIIVYSTDGITWVKPTDLYLDLNKKTFLIDNSKEQTYYLNNVTTENKNNNFEYLLQPIYNNGVPVNIATYPDKNGIICLFPNNPLLLYIDNNGEWAIKNTNNISFFSNRHDTTKNATDNYNIGNSINIVDDNYFLTSFKNNQPEYLELKLQIYEKKINTNNLSICYKMIA